MQQNRSQCLENMQSILIQIYLLWNRLQIRIANRLKSHVEKNYALKCIWCDEIVFIGVVFELFECSCSTRRRKKIMLNTLNCMLRIKDNWQCVRIHDFVVTLSRNGEFTTRSGCRFRNQLGCLVHIQNHNLWTHQDHISRSHNQLKRSITVQNRNWRCSITYTSEIYIHFMRSFAWQNEMETIFGSIEFTKIVSLSRTVSIRQYRIILLHS